MTVGFGMWGGGILISRVSYVMGILRGCANCFFPGTGQLACISAGTSLDKGPDPGNSMIEYGS